MPRVVETFFQTGSYLEVKRQQKALLDLYRLDFSKYAKKHYIRQLQNLFERCFDIVGRHFRYSKIDPESPNPSRDYKEALAKLVQARLVIRLYASSASSLPLRGEIKEKLFKLLFFDIGLWQSAMDSGHDSDFGVKGIISEQFVGQELLAYEDPYLEKNLYFWRRSKPSSSAMGHLSH